MQRPLSVNYSESGIVTLTLNRPEARNALTPELIENLQRILLQIKMMPETRIIILAANGPSFSAGADIQYMQQMIHASKQENMDDALRLAELMRTLNEISKPTIALVHGHAFGGALGLIACCDIVIASDDAQFCFSEVKLGLIPAVISPFVIKAIGQRAARRYFLTAERFNAKTAAELGLVSLIVEQDTLQLAGYDMANLLMNNGPEAMKAAKKLVHEIVHQKIDDALLENVATRIADIRVSPEAQAGMKAFLKRQPPPWLKFPAKK